MFAWRKNPTILADNFVKDYKSCESYLKYCVNILNKLNWLKEHHFDKDIPTHLWIKEFLKIAGFDLIGFAGFFNYFNKNILPHFSLEDLKLIQTNQYCVDSVKEFLENFNNLSNNSITDGSAQIITNSRQHYFTQIFHWVKPNNFAIDETKIFTDDEIIDLIYSQKLLIVDTIAKPSSISEEDLKLKHSLGEIEFLNRDFNGGILGVSSAGDVSGYVEASSEQERDNWIAKNLFKFQWLRESGLRFDEHSRQDDCWQYDESAYFSRVLEHLEVVCSAIEKNYKKRRKTMPDKYKTLLSSIKKSSLEQKNIFNNKNQTTTFVVDDFVSE